MVGMLARLFGRSAEHRRGEWALQSAWHQSHDAISAQRAQSVAAVSACIGLIERVLSSLPATIVTDDGEPAPPTTPALKLLRRPHELISWQSFVSWLSSSVLLNGNAVCQVVSDGRGAIVSLVPVNWDWLSPVLVRTADGPPQLAFDVLRSTEAELLGLPKRLLLSEVLHVKWRTDAGILGKGVLQRSPAAVREALALQTVSESLWTRGMRPSAILVSPTFLTKEQRARYTSDFRDEFAGAFNAGKIPLLENNFKLETLSMNSTDAQFIETRAHNTAAICALFGVPEPLIQLGVRAPADIAVYVTQFCQMALMPLIQQITAEFDHTVLGDSSGLHLQIDADGLARGSFSNTVAALSALKQSAIVTANDAREELGWPAVEGGDVLGISPAPNMPADQLGQVSMSPKPGPSDEPTLPSHQNQGAKGGNGKMPAGMMQ